MYLLRMLEGHAAQTTPMPPGNTPASPFSTCLACQLERPLRMNACRVAQLPSFDQYLRMGHLTPPEDSIEENVAKA